MPRGNKAADTLPEIAADLLLHRLKSGLGCQFGCHRKGPRPEILDGT